MVKTRVASFEGIGKVTLKEMRLTPAPDQVLVKIQQASICGTDKLFFKGEIPAEIRIPIFPWGHEGGGEVIEVGEKVREYEVGDKVMSFGRGTYADYCLFTVPYGCLPAPPGISMELAGLGEPLACAVYAAQEITQQIQIGDVVVVIGAGFAGQVLAQGIKRGGASKVIVTDFIDEKLKLAKQLGADVTINPCTADLEQVIKDMTDNRGADLVAEASGSGVGLNAASSILRRNGTIAIYSHYMKPFMVNMYRWHEDAFNIIHTCLMHRTREEMVVGVREAYRLVQQDLFDISPLLTRSYSLSDIIEAFHQEVQDPRSVKTIISP
jgi:L-iditol 2-dehydrogenase